MGHYHHFYILVPKENLTEEVFRRIVASLKEISPDVAIGKDGPGEEVTSARLPRSITINGLEFSFSHLDVVEMHGWPDAWPLPEGLGTISAMIWSKWFPDEQRGETATTMEVMRRTFTEARGLYANINSELSYEKVIGFKAFMHLDGGYLIFSRELVDLVGRERLASVALVKEFPSGFEAITWSTYALGEPLHLNREDASAGVSSLVDEMLEKAPVLHCEPDRLQPDFDEDQVGLVREPRVRGSWKPSPRPALGASPSPKAVTVPSANSAALAAWAQTVADRGIRLMDKRALEILMEKLKELIRAEDLVGQREMLRQIMRLDWAFYNEMKSKYIDYSKFLLLEYMNHAGHLAGVLSRLGELDEAAMLKSTVLRLYDENRWKPPEGFYLEYAKLLCRMKRYDEAEKLYMRAISTMNPENDYRDFSAGLVLYDVATLNLERGDIAGAERALAQAKPIAASMIDDNPKNISKYMGLRAQVELAKGNVVRAEDLARRGVNFSWSSEHAGGEDVLYNLSILETVLRTKGDAEALAEVERERMELLEAGGKGEYILRKKDVANR